MIVKKRLYTYSNFRAGIFFDILACHLHDRPTGVCIFRADNQAKWTWPPLT